MKKSFLKLFYTYNKNISILKHLVCKHSRLFEENKSRQKREAALRSLKWLFCRRNICSDKKTICPIPCPHRRPYPHLDRCGFFVPERHCFVADASLGILDRRFLEKSLAKTYVCIRRFVWVSCLAQPGGCLIDVFWKKAWQSA